MALLKGRAFRADLIRLEEARLESLTDAEKPPNPNPPPHLMPNEALTNVKWPLQVGHVRVSNSQIVLGTRRSADAVPGLLTFDAVNLTGAAIDNRRGAAGPAILQGHCRLMNAAEFAVWLQMPLNTRELSVRYGGSLGPMELSRLNPYLEEAARARIKSGLVRTATFESRIEGGHALGELHGEYQDLQLVFLDRQTGKEGGLLTKVKSAVADHIVLRTANLPGRNGSMAVGRIDYLKRPNESFPHLVWFGLRSGIVDLVGVSDFVRQAR